MNFIQYIKILCKFKTIGIEVKNIRKMEYSAWMAIYDQIVYLYKKFSELPVGFIRYISIKENDVFRRQMDSNDSDAVTNFPNFYYYPFFYEGVYLHPGKGVEIIFNQKYYGYSNRSRTINELQNVITHEFFHSIDFYYCLKNQLWKNKIFVRQSVIDQMMSCCSFSQQIIRLSRNSTNLKRGYYDENLGVDLSDTNMEDDSELFAEMMTLYVFGCRDDFVTAVFSEYQKLKGG